MMEDIIFDSWRPTLESFLNERDYSKIFYLADKKVADLHGLSLPAEESLIIDVSESTKTLESVVQVWEALARTLCDRQSALVCIGGGIITDLGGFAASTYMRGMDAIYIPTTVLGMVDASIGGKTGFNFMHYKNRIGSFQAPEKVIIDKKYLSTLPEEHWLSGWAELVKHALIADDQLWRNCVQADNLDMVKHVFPDLLNVGMRIKGEIVIADFKEKGERKKLNFGHTIGHALESLLIEKGLSVPHGYAVAAGMLIESDISRRMEYLDESVFNEIKDYILKLYPVLQIHFKDIPKLFHFLKGDKKNTQGNWQFVLLKKSGEAITDQRPEKETIELCIRSYIDEYKNL